MTTAYDGASGHDACHDEAAWPLTLLLGHEGFRRAFAELAVERGHDPEEIAAILADHS